MRLLIHMFVVLPLMFGVMATPAQAAPAGCRVTSASTLSSCLSRGGLIVGAARTTVNLSSEAEIKAGTTLDGRGLLTVTGRGFHVVGDNVTIRNMQFIAAGNGDSAHDGVRVIESNNFRAFNNHFHGRGQDIGDGGIDAEGSTGVIALNRFKNWDGPMLLKNNCKFLVVANVCDGTIGRCPKVTQKESQGNTGVSKSTALAEDNVMRPDSGSYAAAAEWGGVLMNGGNYDDGADWRTTVGSGSPGTVRKVTGRYNIPQAWVESHAGIRGIR